MLSTACASDESPLDARQVTEPIEPPADSSTSTPDALAATSRDVGSAQPPPPTSDQPDQPLVAFNGRIVPAAPATPESAAAAFTDVERSLRIDGEAPEFYADLGHEEQLIVRTLARNPDWHETVLEAVPADLKPVLELHLRARSELGQLHTAPPLETLPAWQIIEPEPLDDLVAHYRAAEAATGIQWEILAAINLIETGMGRIDGLSSAGAQGPMQFLPTTWAEVSDGGDIDDPEDAIHGAARYLVQRGALDDIRAGLFGYNNSDNYVDAVLTYVELLELDERAIRGFYNWEIYVGTDAGTLWLPVGLTTDGEQTAADYLAANPWAETIR